MYSLRGAQGQRRPVAPSRALPSRARSIIWSQPSSSKTLPLLTADASSSSSSSNGLSPSPKAVALLAKYRDKSSSSSLTVDTPRSKPLGLQWAGGSAIIDEHGRYKLMSKPNQGQCDFQPPCAPRACASATKAHTPHRKPRLAHAPGPQIRR